MRDARNSTSPNPRVSRVGKPSWGRTLQMSGEPPKEDTKAILDPSGAASLQQGNDSTISGLRSTCWSSRLPKPKTETFPNGQEQQLSGSPSLLYLAGVLRDSPSSGLAPTTSRKLSWTATASSVTSSSPFPSAWKEDSVWYSSTSLTTALRSWASPNEEARSRASALGPPRSTRGISAASNSHSTICR